MITAYHAKYYALDLAKRGLVGEVDAVGTALFDAQVDLNPHQIEAALVGMEASMERGRILADEVGLGKTIEAALVLSQRWAERKRRLLVIAPASLRKQWSQELEEKFGLPSLVVDTRNPDGNPFEEKAVVIVSYQYAARRTGFLVSIPWDLIVIDEAHRLRNAWRSDSRLGKPLLESIQHAPKLLLTATPLQNSLLELYGIVSVVDGMAFGEPAAFKSAFMKGTPDYEALRQRLQPTVHRTLRKSVLPYIRYTARRSMTCRFKSSPAERELYQAVSDFLARDELFSLPRQQRALITMVLRKLLASSSTAIMGGLEKLRARLEAGQRLESDADVRQDFADEALDEDWLDDLTDTHEVGAEEAPTWSIGDEVAELDRLLAMARAIDVDCRALELVKALGRGFVELRKLGAAEKAVIFTESRRTQAWLKDYLEAHGYAGQIVCFNGENSDPETRAILNAWELRHPDARATGSRATNVRAAIVDHFRDQATLLIATEAGAEGLNLQFASMVVNYDLPWNPQRVEQRIGRCHRYGQRFDVVVINFLDQLNRADERVLELLTDKCQLFDGIFGASDEVLGAIESGVGLEKKIHRIFRTCRTPDAIEAAFAELRSEMDDVIKRREASARQALLDHFDADVHDKLKLRLDEARIRLDRIGRQFWALTTWALADVADFPVDGYRFELRHAPSPAIRAGRYELVSREHQDVAEAFVYRLSHPLGEHVLHAGLTTNTPQKRVVFDISSHPLKVSVVGALVGQSGWLSLERMKVTGLHDEEHLLLSGFVNGGRDLDMETLDRLLSVNGRVADLADDVPPVDRLDASAGHLRKVVLTQAAERNQSEFQEARERLERWADDQIRGAEANIAEIRRELRGLERRAHVAETLEDQREIQRRILEVEADQRKARARVFSIEDEVRDKRRLLMDELNRRVGLTSTFETIYRIAWTVE